MSQHRRIQDGGDPSQGPKPDVANDPPAPRDDERFPDTPPGNRADADADSD